MSGLAGILARRRAPGIYLWHSAYSAEEIRHTVEHAGQHFAHVDGWRGDSKADFLAAIGQALDFPDYYGQNFDALADCLHDVAAARCCSGTVGDRWRVRTSAPSRSR